MIEEDGKRLIKQKTSIVRTHPEYQKLVYTHNFVIFGLRLMRIGIGDSPISPVDKRSSGICYDRLCVLAESVNLL